MKQIPEELLENLIDNTRDQLGSAMALAGTSKRNDAVIADLEQDLNDAEEILYNKKSLL
ncbi:MAG: hypothetical protein U9P90_01530 [Patescibacteria group bacterium]|nr:hypothetical protein [Patescibacteria group bacterium]